MIIFNDAKYALHTHDRVCNYGYGYSVARPERRVNNFRLDGFVDMFSDWGWNGDDSSRPDWIR